MAWMTLTCGQCGHAADIDQFCNTPLNGPLPKNTYQCPSCHYAVEIRAGQGVRYESGLYVPGPLSLVPVAARL